MAHNFSKTNTSLLLFLDYCYNLNPELFKEDVNKDLVERAIIKTAAIMGSRMRLDKKPNMVEELIRWEHASGMF